jgi:hypothetical protein
MASVVEPEGKAKDLPEQSGFVVSLTRTLSKLPIEPVGGGWFNVRLGCD